MADYMQRRGLTSTTEKRLLIVIVDNGPLHIHETNLWRREMELHLHVEENW